MLPAAAHGVDEALRLAFAVGPSDAAVFVVARPFHYQQTEMMLKGQRSVWSWAVMIKAEKKWQVP